MSYWNSKAFNANDKFHRTKNDTLIQGVNHNFDQIFSQNGKLQTHSMALLMTNTDANKRNEIFTEEIVPQISKSAMTQEIPYVIKVEHYTGNPYHQKSKNSTLATLPFYIGWSWISTKCTCWIPWTWWHQHKKSKRRSSIITVKNWCN